MIELRSLGGLSLHDDGRELTSILVQPRRLALLTYLAACAPRRLHRREVLVTLFWPERDEQHARNALRQALHVLRCALGPSAVVARGHGEVGLDPSVVWCDADAFCQACADGRHAEALELYRGDLLEGFHISHAPQFERWLDDSRAELRARARQAVMALRKSCEASGDLAAAAIWARRAVRLFPFDHDSIRRLVVLLDAVGDRREAVEVYDGYARRLVRELELDPPRELASLVARMRSGAPRATTSAHLF